ncbi:MAG: 4-hydroxy-tetrahydrodipicolinate synthase [Thermaerobacter sp.]|nr:4-hydroxy-tetrahydrodipicolinate synthase [Thermaerobacter sp.]
MPVGRLMTAMATPFTAELELDLAKSRSLAQRLVDDGSDGIVVAGTTGESPTLGTEEKISLFEAVADAVGDRATVWANTGNYDTNASIQLTQAAERTGVHGVMLVVPYYNKPSQEGLYRHFRAIAEATRLPVMLYNVPSRTSQNLAADTVLRIARDCPNVVAVKEASGNLEQAAEILRGREGDLSVLSGDDKLTLPLLSVGADGVVSVASHLVGPEIRRMIEAFVTGHVHLAQEIHLRLLPLFTGLFVTSNPVPLKWAMRLCGRDIGGVRGPLAPPSAAEEEFLQHLLRAQGLM